MPARAYDLVVWGATGFTGRLVCEHIAQQYQGEVTWAMAGRNSQKLAEFSKYLASAYPHCKEVPILLGDAEDSASLLRVAQTAKVLLSTAGPYLGNGTVVVEACIKAGTHYADINAELVWMKQVIRSLHSKAAAANVKIVLCCGWDCMPADLGTLFVVQQAQMTLNRKMGKVTNLITDIVGMFSGGSLNTALIFFAKPLEALSPDPYSLNPPDSRRGSNGRQYFGPGFEPVTKLFTSPSFFAPANLRIVRRSNALLGNLYGADFRFDEAFGHASLLKALVTTLSLWIWAALLMIIARVPLLTYWLKRMSLKPGEGPSREMMVGGHWKCQIVGTTEKKQGSPAQIVTAVLQGKGDPGYWQTSRMLLEAGICLAKGDCSPFCVKGGILTPASGLGMPLVERLQRAGITFEIVCADHPSGAKGERSWCSQSPANIMAGHNKTK